MSAWGELAFENDTGCDWAYGLDECEDLAMVEEAFAAVEDEEDYLDADVACEALAACEVIARLNGNHGYQSDATETVDAWAAAHEDLTVPEALVERAQAVIDRVLGKRSELRELWEDRDSDAWRAGVEDLRDRLT